MRKVIVAGTVVIAAAGVSWFLLPKSWLYQNRRPTYLGKLVNRVWAGLATVGLSPEFQVALEVRQRRSGESQLIPLVVARVDGERYVVSMLGERADWVRNVRAARGEAVIRTRHREDVTLEDVPAAERAPILKAYLARAPGGRPHFPIGPDAAVEEFALLADEYPVFRVVPR
ncbi:MAG: nitroreductase/quinone reductase family protein [Anaerolineaceae bacterium]